MGLLFSAMHTTSRQGKGLYMTNQEMFPLWTWLDAKGFTVSIFPNVNLCVCVHVTIYLVEGNHVIPCFFNSYLTALCCCQMLSWNPPSPLAPCLTFDDGKVSARAEDWETFSYWRRTFRVRHCSSFRSGLVDWEQINSSSIPGDRDFQGDQSNNSCQVWASLGLIPHSSSLEAHILTVVYFYSLWTQISRCEGNSASCAD